MPGEPSSPEPPSLGPQPPASGPNRIDGPMHQHRSAGTDGCGCRPRPDSLGGSGAYNAKVPASVRAAPARWHRGYGLLLSGVGVAGALAGVSQAQRCAGAGFWSLRRDDGGVGPGPAGPVWVVYMVRGGAESVRPVGVTGG